MKRFFLILTAVIMTSTIVFAFEGLPVNPGINNAGAINARDMQMLRQQQFRREEYNDFQSLKEVKEKHQKEVESTSQQDKPLYEKMINRKSPAKFVEEEGQIKIEHMQ